MFEPRKLLLVLCSFMICSALANAEEKSEKSGSTKSESKIAESKTKKSIKVELKPQDQKSAEPKTPAPGSETQAGSEADTDSASPKQTEEKSREADKGEYTVRLKDLEGRVNRLKEQIFRSKARLSLLAESVLDKKIAGAKAKIIFRNEMGGSFRLVKATFLLDGAPIFNRTDESGEDLAKKDILELFEGPVVSGDHTLSAILNYRGHGYGIFSYLKSYSFKTKSSRTFTITEGSSLTLEVVGYEKGGATTPLEQRPDVRYILNTGDLDNKETSSAPKGAKK